MAFDIIPSRFWRFPVWDDEDWDVTANSGGGLEISEDQKNVYVQAALPGVDPKDVEITFDKGVLWVKGEVKEEEKGGKKFYRKSHSQFSYRVAVPGEIDQNVDPKAESKHGVMTVTFAKVPQSQPKKISVKSAE